MGDVIQFPIKKIPDPVDPEMARLRRTQEALARINQLMEKIRNERDNYPRD